MAARWIDTQICKALIRSDEPPLLLLSPRPECFICETLLTLHDNSYSIVTAGREQLCHLSRQVFIHINANTPAHPRTTRGIKTVVDHVVDAASGLFGVHLKLPNRDYRLPARLKCKFRLP